MIGQDFAYGCDAIGNRIDAGTPTTYTANNLNQYTATAGPAEPFTYDLDGNLTQDGDYFYSYDAENRLVAVAEPTIPGLPNHTILEFTYDYRGRRVRKVEFWPFDSQYGGIKKDVRFVYDGWNVVMELDGLDDNAVLRRYAWGLDLSGALQGAGGIGGLLAMEDTKGTVTSTDDEHYLYFYDANGNVGQLVDWATSPGAIAAHYEYDPYGNALVSAGAYAAANPYRFSTKYFDAESGYYYYGRRYYSPKTGRWANRDPLGEQDHPNVYTLLSNSPPNGLDPIGLCEHCTGGGTPAVAQSLNAPLYGNCGPMDGLIRDYNAGTKGDLSQSNHVDAQAYWWYFLSNWATQGPDWIILPENDIFSIRRSSQDDLARSLGALKNFGLREFGKLECGKSQLFIVCGSTSFTIPGLDLNLRLALQRVSLYWRAICTIGPKQCCDPKQGGCDAANMKCDISVMLYDRYDFDPEPGEAASWVPYIVFGGWVGQPYNITGFWSQAFSHDFHKCRPKASNP